MSQPSTPAKRVAIPLVNTESKDKHKISGDRSTHLVSSDRELKEQSQTRTTPTTTFSQSTPERSPQPQPPAEPLGRQPFQEQLPTRRPLPPPPPPATPFGRQPFEGQLPIRRPSPIFGNDRSSERRQPMAIDPPANTNVHAPPWHHRPASHSAHPPGPPNQMRRKMTLQEYRASKGLTPYPQQQRRSTPNLFIQRPRQPKVYY